ncbi:MAG: hypothetical protein HQ481_07430 [Alphaproteobacteria bacterium]|nr:hypothetical protein [Alphaproteobacteria bacterium]
MHDTDIDDDGPAGHAMTEIALALAMGFFCILVLALISMGAGTSELTPRVVDALRVAAPGSASARPLDSDETLLIHHNGRFLDAQGRLVALAAMPRSGRVVLAVDPARPMDAALAARALVPAEEVTLAPLDAAWLATLAEGDTP